MDYADDYWGLYRDYYRDPFSHSLLSTRQYTKQAVEDETTVPSSRKFENLKHSSPKALI